MTLVELLSVMDQEEDIKVMLTIYGHRVYIKKTVRDFLAESTDQILKMRVINIQAFPNCIIGIKITKDLPNAE